MPGWCANGSEKNLAISEQAQVFDPSRPELRSRSWDIVVFDPGMVSGLLPPAPTDGDGPPLIPLTACKAVIDTKTYFSDVRGYAEKTCFDCVGPFSRSDVRQVDFLADVPKILFIAQTRGNPATLSIAGREVGIDVYCLAKGRCVSGEITPDGHDTREWRLVLSALVDGSPPLGAFLKRIASL